MERWLNPPSPSPDLSLNQSYQRLRHCSLTDKSSAAARVRGSSRVYPDCQGCDCPIMKSSLTNGFNLFFVCLFVFHMRLTCQARMMGRTQIHQGTGKEATKSSQVENRANSIKPARGLLPVGYYHRFSLHTGIVVIHTGNSVNKAGC